MTGPRLSVKILRSPYEGSGSGVVMDTMQRHTADVEASLAYYGESVLGKAEGQAHGDDGVSEFWAVLVYDAAKAPA